MELTEWESHITHKRIGRPEVPAATRIWISKLPDLIDWLDELTADCPKKQVYNMNDPCGARFPDLPEVL